MAQPPSFPFYPADWLLGTLTFSLAEDGAYLRLVMHQWHAGSVPGDDMTALARILRVPEREARAVWQAVSVKFTRGDDGQWRNARVEKQRDEKSRYHESQAEKGRRSAQRRFNRGSTTVDVRLKPDGQPESNLSLALASGPNGPESRAPEAGAVRRSSYGDPHGFRIDQNAAALIDLGGERVVSVPAGWATKACREYGLTDADVQAFAQWCAAYTRRHGFEDGGKRLAWLDARLAEWRAERARPNDGLRPASEFLSAQAARAADVPDLTPEQRRALLRPARPAGGQS